jgi:hypothetical protein
MTNQRLTRRRLMAITGAGAAAAAGVAGIGLAPTANAGEDATTDGHAHPFADAVIAALREHRIVAIGEIHGQQEHYDAMQTLLFDPRLPDLVDDIVVEFGNALYQPTIDRFGNGEIVEDRDLRLVWRNTTQSPSNTWDSPMYEQFFRAVRAANSTLPAEKRIRILLGDPPIDWADVRTRADVLAFGDRNGHTMSVIEREVLAKGRRALIYYGTNHVRRDGDIIQGIEQATGQRTYVIVAGAHPRLASTPRRMVVPAAGTWLASAGTIDFQYLPGECGEKFGEIFDALLYLGQVEVVTRSLTNPAIFLDPEYWAELQRRKTIKESDVNLDEFRQEQSVTWQARPPEEC